MRDERLARLAEVLVGFSGRTKPGDLLMIEAPDVAEPLAVELYRSALAAGAHPSTRISLEGLSEIFYREASDEQLDWISPIRHAELSKVDVRIAIEGTTNTRSLSAVPPSRLARFSRAQQPLVEKYLDRAARGELRWVLSAFPTAASAQDAEMSLREYEDFVYRACLLDNGDPIARWHEFGERIVKLAGWLDQRREIRVVAEGTDLRLGVGGRKWIPCVGHENFPDGEVFTGPVETEVDGVVSFTWPAVFKRREVDGVQLRFEGGAVVEATARHGQGFLDEMLEVDEGARRLGEFAFGLNDAVSTFTKNILFDEKIGGTVHMALGAAYPESGGLNRSGLHWDMILDLRPGSEVFADGELVYRDGRFLDGLFA